jgi:hypothetical protein
MLPRRIPKAPKRASRWRSQAHCNFVRSHECSTCGSAANIEVAHVRLGSGAGIGQKPDDWNTVSLCGGQRGCHALQHRLGEISFWASYEIDPQALIAAFIKASPKRHEIEQARRERETSPREPVAANNRPGLDR